MIKHEEPVLSANEAACVTAVPLKQVHRIIDGGLLSGAVRRRKGARVILQRALVGLKLAHETSAFLTPEGRRRLVRHVLGDPAAGTVREDAVSVDLRPMKNAVKRGLSALEKARKMIVSDQDILGGAPCFKGTRITVHDIAEMLANGDRASAILAAYPMLTEAQVAAAAIYAEAYPRRGRPRRQARWREAGRHSSTELEMDILQGW